MMRNILTYIFGLIAVTAVLISCGDNNSAVSDVFDAVPENSSFVISTTNFDSVAPLFSNENALMRMFYSPKSDIGMPISGVVDSLKGIGMFGDHLSPEAVVAVRKDGNSGLCQLLVCRTDMGDKSTVSELIDSLKRIDGVEARIFNEVEIIRLKSQSFSSSLSMAFSGGLAMFSSSAKYIEDALSCVSGTGKRLKDNECFSKAWASSGKNEIANVLFDSKAVLDIFKSELFDDCNVVADAGIIDSWFTFDVVSKSPLSLNGFEFAKSDSSSFSMLVKSQPDIEFSLLSVIPDKSAAYMLVSFADAQRYDEALTAFMESTGKSGERKRKIDKMNEAFGFDAKSKFYSMIKREVAYIVSENSEDSERGVFVACGLQSQSSAELLLGEMVSDSDVQNIDDPQDVKIFHLPYDDIPYALFGDLFSNCRGEYVCCINNFLVFANSVDDIRMLVREVSLNNTMKASISHREFLDRFSTSSTIFMYYSIAGGSEIMKRVFSRQYASDIDSNRSEIGSNGVLGIQLKRLDDLVYCNVSFGVPDSKLSVGSEIIWETNVGASLATKPFVVRNHDTGEKEIIVQAKNNMLYLFDASGKEIWHILVDDAITSQIVQVDAYKNGKLQYVFSTKDRIYMVDRLGNFITKFPLTLRGEATSPLSVFDYENNRNYRMFVACDDKGVYVYDVTGNLLKGWDFPGTENRVESEISHYVISGEDFIVFHDIYKAYFVARTGNSKLEFLTNFKFSSNNMYCDVNGTPKFVTTDENGVVRRFFKDKHQDSLKLGDFSENHRFAMKDIDADGRLDYVFADSTKLMVFSNNAKLLFEHDFESEISAMNFYQFGGQMRIGVTAENKKLYLLNMNGTLYDGFPLDGETQFSIFEADGGESYSLVTGLKGRLINYRITK
ncbi:MAG: hypothetical protein J6T63_07700 [Bacteroidales bacterium]|nr:hypothetical protein [Bacteroidales bacterium]